MDNNQSNLSKYQAATFSKKHATNNYPKVQVFGTGGTISASSKETTDVTNYQSGEFSIESILDSVPELSDIAHLTAKQITNTSSSDINSEILLNISNQANQLLKSDMSGVVITHGTNTMEETAFFLELTAQTTKPIVLVGAMRPATAISSDGPMNLLNAVKLAVSPSAVGRGVMIIMITSVPPISRRNPTPLR